jgi:hypothetical protein
MICLGFDKQGKAHQLKTAYRSRIKPFLFSLVRLLILHFPLPIFHASSSSACIACVHVIPYLLWLMRVSLLFWVTAFHQHRECKDMLAMGLPGRKCSMQMSELFPPNLTFAAHMGQQHLSLGVIRLEGMLVKRCPIIGLLSPSWPAAKVLSLCWRHIRNQLFFSSSVCNSHV